MIWTILSSLNPSIFPIFYMFQISGPLFVPKISPLLLFLMCTLALPWDWNAFPLLLCNIISLSLFRSELREAFLYPLSKAVLLFYLSTYQYMQLSISFICTYKFCLHVCLPTTSRILLVDSDKAGYNSDISGPGT